MILALYVTVIFGAAAGIAWLADREWESRRPRWLERAERRWRG